MKTVNCIFSKQIYIAFLVVFFSFTIGNLKASRKYVVNKYTTENGLQSNLISSVEFDKNGFLWIATQAGLSRFDGTNFKHFNSSNYEKISSNRFNYLIKDDLGHLYILNDIHQLFVVNSKSEISVLQNYTVGRDFIVTGNSKIVFFSSKSFFLNNIGDFDINKKNLYASNDTSYYIVKSNHIKYRSISNTYVYEHKINTRFSFYLQDYFFVINENGVIYGYKHGGFVFSSKLSNILGENININKCFFKQHKNVLSIDTDSVLYELKFEKVKFELYKFYFDSPYIKKKTLLRVSNDSNFNIVYSTIGGLYFFRTNNFINKTIVDSLGFKKEVYRLAGFKMSEIFTENSKFKINKNITLSDYVPFTIDSFTYLLVNNEKAYVYKPQIGIVDSFFFEWRSNSSNFNVYKVKQEFIVQHGDAVYSYSKYNGFKKIFAIPGNFINTICKVPYKSDDWLLAKKGKNGLFLFNNKQNTFKTIDNLSKLNVRHVFYDSLLQVYWVFTYGSGIFWLDHCFNSKPIFIDKNNSLLYSHYCLIDSLLNYWIPTNNGLYRLGYKNLKTFKETNNLNPLEFDFFNSEIGLSSNEFNGGFSNSGIVLPNGCLVFSCIEGYVVVNPSDFFKKSKPNPIFLESISLNNQQIDFNGNIEIEEGFGYINLFFSSPNFDLSLTHTLEYKIIGLDNEWKPMLNNVVRIFTLTNGNYKLCVRNRAKSDSSILFLIPISVYKQWYLTPLAILTYIVLLLLIGYIISRHYFKLIQKRNQRELVLLENELMSLREQINPHYLSNSLVSLQNMLLDDDQEKVFNILGNYGKVMRKMLEKSDDSYISLQTELDTIKEYVYLESQVHKKEIAVIINLDELPVSANDIKIPVFLLQPIIENALIHGLFPKKEGERILEINCTLLQEYIKIEIIDNGVGFNPSYATHRKSYGMENIRKRLNLLEKIHQLELDFSIQNISNNQKTGTHVTINLPIKKS